MPDALSIRPGAIQLLAVQSNSGTSSLKHLQRIFDGADGPPRQQDRHGEKSRPPVPLGTVDVRAAWSQTADCRAQCLGRRCGSIQYREADISWGSPNRVWFGEFRGQVDVIVEIFFAFRRQKPATNNEIMGDSVTGRLTAEQSCEMPNGCRENQEREKRQSP